MTGRWLPSQTGDKLFMSNKAGAVQFFSKPHFPCPRPSVATAPAAPATIAPIQQPPQLRPEDAPGPSNTVPYVPAALHEKLRNAGQMDEINSGKKGRPKVFRPHLRQKVESVGTSVPNASRRAEPPELLTHQVRSNALETLGSTLPTRIEKAKQRDESKRTAGVLAQNIGFSPIPIARHLPDRIRCPATKAMAPIKPMRPINQTAYSSSEGSVVGPTPHLMDSSSKYNEHNLDTKPVESTVHSGSVGSIELPAEPALRPVLRSDLSILSDLNLNQGEDPGENAASKISKPKELVGSAGWTTNDHVSRTAETPIDPCTVTRENSDWKEEGNDCSPIPSRRFKPTKLSYVLPHLRHKPIDATKPKPVAPERSAANPEDSVVSSGIMGGSMSLKQGKNGPPLLAPTPTQDLDHISTSIAKQQHTRGANTFFHKGVMVTERINPAAGSTERQDPSLIAEATTFGDSRRLCDSAQRREKSPTQIAKPIVTVTDLLPAKHDRNRPSPATATSAWSNFANPNLNTSTTPSRAATPTATNPVNRTSRATQTIDPLFSPAGVQDSDLFFTSWPSVADDFRRKPSLPRTIIISDLPQNPTLSMISAVCTNAGPIESVSLMPSVQKAIVHFIFSADAALLYDRTGNGFMLHYSREGRDLKKIVFVDMRPEIDVLASATRAKVDAGHTRVVRIVGWVEADLVRAVGKRRGETVEELLMTLAQSGMPDGKYERIESVGWGVNALEYREAWLVYAGMKEALVSMMTIRKIVALEACNVTFGKDPCERNVPSAEKIQWPAA